MKRSRLLVLVLALLTEGAHALGAAPGTNASDPAKPRSEGRVVILGFDGADANKARALMEADPQRFPNFKKLSDTGTFAPLEVVVPAESPVSWASLNSGQNPAKTGVPGFIKREVGKVLPTFGHIKKDSGKLEDFEHTPIPVWTPTVTAAVAGGAVFLATVLLVVLAFRKLFVALALGVLLGGGAAFLGHEARAMLPATFPRTYNVNRVESFWDVAARAGVPCVVLDAQQAFDWKTTPGAKVLYGLGLPDARGELGQWFVYTSDPTEFKNDGRDTTTAGTVYRVDEQGGVINTRLFGPENFVLKQNLTAELDQVKKRLAVATISMEESSALSAKKQELDQRLKDFGIREPDVKKCVGVDMTVRLEDGKARVAIAGREQTLAVGQWSEFYDVTFEFNWLLKVHAITRVKLVQLEPYFELLVNVLDIDPRNPPFWQPVSSPFEFSAELARDCGLFETYGWPTLTMPFKDEEITPETLLEDVQFTEGWRENLTHDRLARDDWRMLMSVFSTTDRVQHMTYQFHDPGHPLHRPEVAKRELSFFGESIPLSEAIPAIYRKMDAIIGDVLAKLRPEDTLFVISDHGFASFRRQVHVNNWLAENGYLTLKQGVNNENNNYLGFVDWSRTRAYAVGLGFIYVNLEGREPNGIVSRDDYRPLLEEIRTKLLAARDPESGDPICTDVYFPRDIHSGEHLAAEADIIPGFKPPYRVGWSSSSGGLNVVSENGVWKAGPYCTDNDSNWSGDHVSMALSEVPGVFFSNRKVAIPPEGVRALQIAPTVLTLLGVPVPPEMDLPALEVN